MADIKVIPSRDPRLGRHVEHDPASRAFAYRPRKALPQVNVRHARQIPVFDQGNLGSCTGNSGMGCLGTGGFYDTVKDLIADWSEDSAVKLYSEATAIDEFPGTYPPTDTGSSGLAIAKVLTKRQHISGYEHAFSFEAALAALQEKPVITGVNWYDNFFYPDHNGIITIGGSIAGGHEFVLDEIDWDRKLIGAQNSWGPYWGVSGRFYIPFDVYARLLKEDGDVTIFTPITQSAPVPTPSPDPVVDTPVDVADQVLWDSVRDWANARHYTTNKKAATAVKKWAADKGLI